MLTESQIKRLSDARIARFFRAAAAGKKKELVMPGHFALDLLGIIAIQGNRIADALIVRDQATRRTRPHTR